MKNYAQMSPIMLETHRPSETKKVWTNLTGQLFSVKSCSTVLAEQHHATKIILLGLKNMVQQPLEKCKFTG